MTLDEQLESKGLVTIAERLKCEGPMDSFARHVGVNTLEDFRTWLENERRSNMEMIARHDLGVYELDDDIADFVYGKSAVLWEVHVNLLHVMRGVDVAKSAEAFMPDGTSSVLGIHTQSIQH